MPANVSPEYKRAEAEYRKTRDPQERLRLLKEMLRTIPKHKGTEHMQADIKTRMKQLTEELTGSKKGGARTGPAQAIKPEGAGQVALIGPPNSGKSSLHVRLTGSHAEIGPYPFTTKFPLPGMLPFEDIHFQLVDLPPVSGDYMEPWFVNALQPADAALLVVDLSDPACAEQVLVIRRRLDEKRVALEERWPFPLVERAGPHPHRSSPTADAPDPEPGADTVRSTGSPPGAATAHSASSPHDVDPAHATSRPHAAGTAHTIGIGTAPTAGTAHATDEDDDPFRIHLPTLLIANKADLDPDPEEIEVLEELLSVQYPAVAVSAQTGAGLEKIGPILFRGLGIVRVYTKAPGREPDTDRPYSLRAGATVRDLAILVHKDFAQSLKFARVWGEGVFNGQQVGADHVLRDRNVVELHI